MYHRFRAEITVDEPEYSFYKRTYGITQTFTDYTMAKNAYIARLNFIHKYPNNEVISVELVPEEEKTELQGRLF